jgi:predicted lipid carrier protein YhbT
MTANGGGPADVTVSGTASDLLLFIMGRRSPDEMRIEGDRALAAAWGDLAGKF